MKKQATKVCGLVLTLCAVLAAIAAAAGNVSAQLNLPDGSYRQSCKNIGGGFDKFAAIFAECRKTDGNYAPQTKLERFYLCDGEIWNDNGRLTCTINENKPAYKYAQKVVGEASQMVYGSAPKEPADYWISLILTGGKLDSQYYGSSPALLYSLVSIMKKSFPSLPKSAREDVIKRMSLAVYGREQPQLIAPYDQKLLTGKYGYNDLVAAETVAISKNPIMRRYMINSVYQDAMGRNAKKEDFDYWLPRFEHYQQILDAARNYLYSNAGETDLRETAKAAYKVNNKGKEPSETELDGMIKLLKATGKKLIYLEMIQPIK